MAALWTLLRNGFTNPASTLLGALPVIGLAVGAYFEHVPAGWWPWVGAGIIAVVGWVFPGTKPPPPSP